MEFTFTNENQPGLTSLDSSVGPIIGFFAQLGVRLAQAGRDAMTNRETTDWPRRAPATTATPDHPLLAVAAGTGDVLMSRLREGRANTARGAAHFLRETVGRVRYAASGQITLGPTAASIPTPWSPSAASWTCASPSPSASTKACAISSRPSKLPGRR